MSSRLRATGALVPFLNPDGTLKTQGSFSSGQIYSRAHDLKNHMTEHFPDSKSHHSTKNMLAVIESQVLGTLLSSEAGQYGQYSASLEIQWDILGFMRDQFPDKDFPNTDLSLVVTISGSAEHAQATSCSEYIRQYWPIQGSRVLDALQRALDSPAHTSQSVFNYGALPTYTHLTFDVTLGKVVLNIISGSQYTIVDVVQQLTWMGAALRTSKDGRVQYCESKLQEVGKAKGVKAIFNLTFDNYSPGEDDQSCWFSLFTNPVIAQGFPTARRNNNEVGLELPLDMMAALGGARYAMDFEGGLVLKGDSTLFVPIRRYEDSVQWHFLHARGEERISYHEASLQCPNRVLLLDHEKLRTTRAFLGWWKEAETHLGTEDADYKSIDWSTAEEAGPSLRLTGVTIGLSKIISTQMNFALGGKEGSFHYSQDGPFRKTIDRAENLPVVLYDQKDRRTWLVPAILVILHMIQLQNHLKPFLVGGNKVKIYPLDPSRQRHAAKEAVAKNKSQTLFDCESNEQNGYCFRDAVLDIWTKLDRLMEREATTQATPGMAVNSTWHKTLHGWEFKAVADEDTLLKQKKQVLKKTAGEWYDLVKEVDGVVLFASGLGDIIKPISDLDGLCRKWRSLPKDKDYLAICVPMLEMFYAKAGHRQDHRYLTSAKLQWHRGSMLFEQCVSGNGSNCHDCDRTQQVYHDSYKTIGHGRPPDKLEANGCVVIGQAHHPFRFSTIFASREKAVYKSPNNPDEDTANANKVTGIDNGMLSPAAPVSAESRGINDHETRSLSWPPSFSSFNDDLLQEDHDVSERSKRLSYAQTQVSDQFIKPHKSKYLKAFPDDSAVYLTEHHSIFRHGTNSNETNLGPAQTAPDSKAHDASVHARKVIRRKGRLEDYNHRYGCTCTTCSSVEFEPPDSIELVPTTNGPRRKSVSAEERRARQSV